MEPDQVMRPESAPLVTEVTTSSGYVYWTILWPCGRETRARDQEDCNRRIDLWRRRQEMLVSDSDNVQ